MVTMLVGLCHGASSAELAAAWEAARPKLEVHVDVLPTLGPAEWEALARGAVVKERRHEAGADRAIGTHFAPLPLEQVWLGILDDAHFTLVTGLVEEEVPGSTPADRSLYQRIDLPWPFEDRQWVIRIRNDADLRAATSDGAWERVWDLADPSVAPHPAPDAVWTPVNEGGWLLLRTPTGTIVVYHVRTTVSGTIPDEVVTRWALATLDELLYNVAARGAQIPAHYGPEHAPLQAPGGQPIPPFVPQKAN